MHEPPIPWENGSDAAARWRPDIGWFQPALDPEAILDLKAAGRQHD